MTESCLRGRAVPWFCGIRQRSGRLTADTFPLVPKRLVNAVGCYANPLAQFGRAPVLQAGSVVGSNPSRVCTVPIAQSEERSPSWERLRVQVPLGISFSIPHFIQVRDLVWSRISPCHGESREFKSRRICHFLFSRSTF